VHNLIQEMTPTHDSIRGWFAAALYNEMEKDDRIWLLTGDLGYGMLDKIRDDFPERFLNVGASEQVLIGAGVGLALSGKIPFCYSITTFLIYRAFEWHRNYLHYEDIPVRLIGSGFDDDYKHDGITHQPFEVGNVLSIFPNIHQYYPVLKESVPPMLKEMLRNHKPAFMCLRR
jgi:transketolase